MQDVVGLFGGSVDGTDFSTEFFDGKRIGALVTYPLNNKRSG
jgi:hypothetical protein